MHIVLWARLVLEHDVIHAVVSTVSVMKSPFAFYASPASACLSGLKALPVLQIPIRLDAKVFWIVGHFGSILTG